MNMHNNELDITQHKVMLWQQMQPNMKFAKEHFNLLYIPASVHFTDQLPRRFSTGQINGRGSTKGVCHTFTKGLNFHRHAHSVRHSLCAPYWNALETTVRTLARWKRSCLEESFRFIESFLTFFTSTWYLAHSRKSFNPRGACPPSGVRV